MGVAAVCLYNKFGHCKYGHHCRLEHEDQLCSQKDCEIHKCRYRHPRRCTYFTQYGLCKFGAYCSYLHIANNENSIVINEEVHNIIGKMKEKINAFETKLEEREFKVASLETEVNFLKDENMKLKIEVEKVIDTMKKHTEITIKNTVDSVVKQLTFIQNTKEQKTDLRLTALEEQIAQLLNVMKNTSQARSNQTKNVPLTKSTK